MPQIYQNMSQHYLGERGESYFSIKFGSDMEFGRIFQSRYFLPYCREDWVLLDFGCADGLFLRNLPAREKIGVEVNPAARERCTQVGMRSADQIELHKSLISVESHRVDVVISNHCLEHVLAPFDTLKEILRILKPNGMFVVMVPFDDYRSKKNKTWKSRDLDNHLYTWSPMNLGNLLKEVGFAVERIDIHTRAWSPKLFWLHRVFGESIFRLSCYLLGAYKGRHEVFGIGRKPIPCSEVDE